MSGYDLANELVFKISEHRLHSNLAVLAGWVLVIASEKLLVIQIWVPVLSVASIVLSVYAMYQNSIYFRGREQDSNRAKPYLDRAFWFENFANGFSLLSLVIFLLDIYRYYL